MFNLQVSSKKVSEYILSGEGRRFTTSEFEFLSEEFYRNPPSSFEEFCSKFEDDIYFHLVICRHGGDETHIKEDLEWVYSDLVSNLD